MRSRVVVLARAGDPGPEIPRRLEALGARVLAVQAVRIGPPADPAAFDAALGAIERFDWIVLASAHAARAVAERLTSLGTALPPGRPRIAAVGEATARAARTRLRAPDLVPTRGTAEGLVSALRSVARGRRFLLPRSSIGRLEIERGLGEAGAEVVAVTAYRAEPAGPSACPEALERLQRAGVIAFTSPSTLKGLEGMLGTERFERLAGEAALVAMGPTTAGAIRRRGLEVRAQAEPPTAGGLVEAVARALAGRA